MKFPEKKEDFIDRAISRYRLIGSDRPIIVDNGSSIEIRFNSHDDRWAFVSLGDPFYNSVLSCNFSMFEVLAGLVDVALDYRHASHIMRKLLTGWDYANTGPSGSVNYYQQLTHPSEIDQTLEIAMNRELEALSLKTVSTYGLTRLANSSSKKEFNQILASMWLSFSQPENEKYVPLLASLGESKGIPIEQLRKSYRILKSAEDLL